MFAAFKVYTKWTCFFPVKFSHIFKPVNLLHFNNMLPLISVYMQNKSVNSHEMTIQLHGIKMTLKEQFITPVFL